MRQGRSFRQRMPTGARTPTQRAIAVLRKYGTDAHIYLPGVGMLNGLQAGNYLDSAGTTAATVDQPVGLVLDATGGLGVNIYSGPDLTLASATEYYGPTDYTALGKTYQVFCQNTDVRFNFGVGWIGLTIGFNYLVSTTSGVALRFRNFGSGSVTFTPSVREVTGIHAQQPTTSAKPILRRGAVNLLTYSGDFSNAVWTKSATTISGNRIIETAATSGHSIAETVTVVNAAAYTIAVECSAAERNYIGVYAGTPGQGVIFNLTTGAYFGNVVAAPSSYSISPTGYGSYICVINYTATSTASAPSVYLCDNLGSFSYPGDVSKGINVAKMAIFQGTYTAQQIQALGGIPLTTTAPASTALGPQYWSFDGSNDSLSLGGPLFQMADDHCVIAGGMYSGNNSSNNVVASPSQGAAITNRAGQVSYDDNNDSLQSSWYDGVNYDKLEFSYPKETGFVVTAAKRGSLVIQRVGGVQRGTKSATVAFVSDRGSIGAYSGGQNQFNGSIYPVIAIKGTVSDADLLLLEKWVGQLSGVTI